MSNAPKQRAGEPRKIDTYKAAVMLRLTSEFTERLDKVVAPLLQRERDNGRARKVGRATVVYEAMVRGLPMLETEMAAKGDAEQP